MYHSIWSSVGDMTLPPLRDDGRRVLGKKRPWAGVLEANWFGASQLPGGCKRQSKNLVIGRQ